MFKNLIHNVDCVKENFYSNYIKIEFSPNQMERLSTMIEIILYLSVNLFMYHLKLEYFRLLLFQTLLTVTVKDVNDHDPIFTQKKYNFNVSENDNDGNRTINVSVGKIIANDTDKHSSIVYRIVTSDVESLFNVTQVRFMSYIFFFT